MERNRLQYAIEVYGASRNGKGMSIELAVRDWARHNANAAKIVEEVDLYHALECTRRLFSACGISDLREAKSRSLLLYACVFRFVASLRSERFDDDLDALKQRVAERIVPDSTCGSAERSSVPGRLKTLLPSQNCLSQGVNRKSHGCNAATHIQGQRRLQNSTPTGPVGAQAIKQYRFADQDAHTLPRCETTRLNS